MNVSEEYKITAGTISGATLKSIDIEPSIIVDGKSYTASEFNKAVEMLKQPQLNNNQKLLLEDLREIKESQKDKNMLGLIWVLGQRFTTKSNIKSFTDQEILQVLQALKQEEE
nr:MAG TPA: hypothetical protein [Caudoviricetes sp.]